MTHAFPIDRYLDAAKTVSLDDYDWSQAKAYPLSPDVERALIFMLRIEGQTLFYVRDLLNTRTAYIPEISSFISVWLYEEERHSRMLRRFLSERGIDLPEDDHAVVRKASARGLREWIEAQAVKWMARATENFAAVHMVWGATQELAAIHGYQRVADECNHPLLRQLCLSIIKDERRHFAFYYNLGERLIQPTAAQSLVRFIMWRWWAPVGFGIHAPEHAHFMVDWFYGYEGGLEVMQTMDRQINKLPGLQDMPLFERAYHRAKAVVRDGRARGSRFADWIPVPLSGEPSV